MVACFLVFFNAAGAETLTELSIGCNPIVVYLPNKPNDDVIDLVSVIDDEHSVLCLGWLLMNCALAGLIGPLELHPDHILLRMLDESNGSSSVLAENRVQIQLPLSTASHLKSVLLRADDQFYGPTGRWAIRWDDEHGTISNSMRPPPLKEVTEDEEALATETQLKEIETVEMVSQTRSSSSTASPTPSPNRKRGQEQDPRQTSVTPTEMTHEESPPGATKENLNEDLEGQFKSPDRGAGAHKEDGASSLVGQPPGQEQVSKQPGGSTERVGQQNTVSEEAGPTNYAVVCPTGEPKAPAPRLAEVESPNPLYSSDRLKKRKREEIETLGEILNSMVDKASFSGELTSPDTIIVKRIRNPQEREEMKALSEEQTTSPNHSILDASVSSQSTSSGAQATKRSRSIADGCIGPLPVVIFSSSPEVEGNKNAMDTFERVGGRVTKSISKANILCVKDGPLKKTGKFIMAVAMGLDVVTEKWIIDTHRHKRFPSPCEYLPLDRSREREWNFKLKEAIARGKGGLAHLLAGTTVILTQQIRKDLGSQERDSSQIATMLGADAVRNRLPALKDKDKYDQKQLLIIGAHGDPQAGQVGRLGQRLFLKDILTMAALRGEVDRSSAEFAIDVPIKDEDQA